MINSTIYNPLYECMDPDELRELQLRRLKDSVAHHYNHVEMYRNRCREHGVTPLDIEKLEDLSRFPFMVKADFNDHYPFGLFAVPMAEVVRIQSSSGTTSRPKVVGYTSADIGVWSEVCARTLGCAGVTRKDIVQVCYGYGMFTGGLGIHYGAERLGATVIPISGGNSKRQVTVMADFGTTVLAATPSYALNMAEVARDMGMRDRLRLRVGVFGAEPWSDGMRQELQRQLGLHAFDIYGLSELIGPGVAAECEHQCGLHVFEDHFYPEIIDSQTGEVLPEGTKGELVLTSLTKQALPVTRYRTGDITALHRETCACGRTMARIDRITGRSDDMMIIRGVNVFPSQIEEVLTSVEGFAPHYQIHIHREGAMDSLELWVEVTESVFSDDIRTLESLARKLTEELRTVLGLTCRVRLVEPSTIERSEGKSKRIVDHRKL